jgi:hypothetical protein
MASDMLNADIFTRFYGSQPPHVLVSEGEYFLEKGTWFMSADYVDGYGAQPHMDVKAKGFERMRKFFCERLQ